MFTRSYRLVVVFAALLPVLAGCGTVNRTPPPRTEPVDSPKLAAPSPNGLKLPASVTVDDGAGGLIQLHVGSVVAGGSVASAFGSRGFSLGGTGADKHDGIDIVAPAGTPIRAAADGKIADIGWRGAYGRYVRIKHSDRIETAYAHLSNFVDGLALGQTVRRDSVIGYVGTTGNATGPHLHYEVRRAGRAIDPLVGGSSSAR